MEVTRWWTFDLIHPGHLNFLSKIKTPSSKLIVGVISDSNVETYKRKPILDTKSRAIMLSEMKMVDQVIEDCPFGGITEEFIKKYQITKVVYAGDEGTWEDHYKIPIDMGIMSYIKYDESNILPYLVPSASNANYQNIVFFSKI